MNSAAEINAALRRKFSPERLAGVIAGLPNETREKIKRTFEPQPVKRIIRIKTRRK